MTLEEVEKLPLVQFKYWMTYLKDNINMIPLFIHELSHYIISVFYWILFLTKTSEFPKMSLSFAEVTIKQDENNNTYSFSTQGACGHVTHYHIEGKHLFWRIFITLAPGITYLISITYMFYSGYYYLGALWIYWGNILFLSIDDIVDAYSLITIGNDYSCDKNI